MVRIAVLVSGGGTNLQALIDAALENKIDGEIVFDAVPGAVAAIKSNPSEIAEWLPSFLEMDYPDFYSGSNEERIMKYHIAW